MPFGRRRHASPSETAAAIAYRKAIRRMNSHASRIALEYEVIPPNPFSRPDTENQWERELSLSGQAAWERRIAENRRFIVIR